MYLNKRWGEGIEDPSMEDLRAALKELESSDSEHPDCSVADDKGWSLAVFESGLAVLENVETGEGPWHKRQVGFEAALELWQMLLSGDLEALKSCPGWADGYGS